MRKFLALILILSGATSAVAAEKTADAPAKGPSNSVAMPPVIAPVVMNGKLAGYFYISCKLTAASHNGAIAISQKLAFIQDAFVRDVNIRPLTVLDAEKVDRVQLGNHLMEDARAIVGAGMVTGITFGDGDKDIGLKFASLRPDETPSAVAFEDVPVAEAKPAPPKAH